MRHQILVPRVGDWVVAFLPSGPRKGEARPAVVIRCNAKDSLKPLLGVFLEVGADGMFASTTVKDEPVRWAADAAPGTWMWRDDYLRRIRSQLEYAEVDDGMLFDPKWKLDAEQEAELRAEHDACLAAEPSFKVWLEYAELGSGRWQFERAGSTSNVSPAKMSAIYGETFRTMSIPPNAYTFLKAFFASVRRCLDDLEQQEAGRYDRAGLTDK